MRTNKNDQNSLRPYSSAVLDGDDRAAARAMLYPTGFKPADFKKPVIGIASTWSNVTPCNMHIDKRALEAEAGTNAAGGKAIVCNSEEAALKAILAGKVKKGHIVVIRYEGPKGGPGMREMLSPTSAIIGEGLGQDVALITDGRFSGGSHGFVVGHITPEAYLGGSLALVKNGDAITVDAEKHEINLAVTADELKQRKKAWKAPKPRYTRDVLAKYAHTVSSASLGAVTDLDL